MLGLAPRRPWINEALRVSPWIMGFACGIGGMLAGGILVLFSVGYFETRSRHGQL